MCQKKIVRSQKDSETVHSTRTGLQETGLQETGHETGLKQGLKNSKELLIVVTSIFALFFILGFFLCRSLMMRVEILETLVNLTSLSMTH